MLFVQRHSVNVCTESRVLFFGENWDLKVKAVAKMSFLVCLFALYSQKYVPVLVV